MSTKQAINDKLQGSVATYLRCGGVVNNQIKKGLSVGRQPYPPLFEEETLPDVHLCSE